MSLNNESSGKAPPTDSPVAKKAGLDPALKKKVGIGIGAVFLVLVSWFTYDSYEYVSTDNAQVGAPSTLLSAKVSGIVVRANVEENQKVKAGEVLVEIKPDDYQNVVDQLEADVASYQAQLKAAQSSYTRTVSLFHKGA